MQSSHIASTNRVNVASFVLLLGLTLVTYLTAEGSHVGNQRAATLLIAALVGKFLLISFGFMGLSKAHFAWRLLAGAYIGLLAEMYQFAMS